MAEDIPGTSLFELIEKDVPERVAFSEYHAMGSKTAAFMVRKGPWKLVYYADYPAQLFNLDDDPEEVSDLTDDPASAAIKAEMLGELRRICDPVEVDKAVRESQARMIEENGGKEKIIKRGDLGFSMPPGVEPQFN